MSGFAFSLAKRNRGFSFHCSWWLWVLALGMLLCGCALPSPANVPTPYPSEVLPTLIAQTVQARRTEQAQRIPSGASQQAERTQAPSEIPLTSPTATQTPTVTHTPRPEQLIPLAVTPPSQAAVSNALIQINRPGPYSKVVSPISLQAVLKPGKGKQVQIELFGEDRRVLVRLIQPIVWIDQSGFARLYKDIPFEIPGVAEAAWLTLSVTDDLGRVTAVNSTPLILLSIGESDIIPAVDFRTPILIQQPRPNALIQGKKVIASGLVRSGGDTYLMIQLWDPTGKVLGQRVTNTQPAEELGFSSFNTEVPYTITEPTPALLVVWQGVGSLSNILYLSSVEVLLSP
ncbi:MAG: hypothetical protein DDG59_06355 [Anaerolineae bacterium]|jgi:hypothetical protein|nr:MAG: hypothetical protein DDG59_06355 [Anaerolineae bacterium]